MSGNTHHAFTGLRTSTTTYVYNNGQELSAETLPLYAASCGFEWGYGGGGPIALAYALLYHTCGQHIAQRHTHTFKDDVIKSITTDTWSLTSEFIWDWVHRQR